MPRKQLEPVRCVCGKRAWPQTAFDRWRILCSSYTCWYGPRRTTLLAAAKAWNDFMFAAKVAKTLRRREKRLWTLKR